MEENSFKPVIRTTFFTARTTLALALLVAGFLALLALYLASDRRAALRRAAATPVATTVDMPDFTAVVPPGWQSYSRSGRVLRMFRRTGAGLPSITLAVARDEAFAFRALDTNPAFVVRKLARALGPDANVTLLGSETVPVDPGIPAVHFFFERAATRGEGLFFYKDDAEYLFWGLAATDDAVGQADIRGFMRAAFTAIVLPDRRERFDRPVIQSGLLAYEDTRRALATADKELALFRLYSARADAAPDANLVPALRHFHDTIHALSSVRQERALLNTPAFARYQALAAARRQEVAEWFVLLAKDRAMGDNDAARAQAQFIIEHATLDNEADDVLRAKAVLDAIPVPAAAE